MSPEGRKPSSLGPLARDKYKRTGKFAALALVVAAGLVTPAAALARTDASHMTAASGGDCGHHKSVPGGGHDKDKCPKPKPTHTTPSPSPTKTKPPKGCFDIDSAGHGGDVKFVSVVCNGQVFVLTVDETGNPLKPGVPVGGWTTVGAPNNVIDATLAVTNNSLHVTVLTADQRVFEASCVVHPLPNALGTCTQFVEFPRPPA